MGAQSPATVLVSVVVAAYNAEDGLPGCILSVLAQSHVRVELVCVDDGSTDGTACLLDDAASRDPRVKVTHQPNAGVSAARNRGLALATGDVVLFVDADDQLLPGAVARVAEDYARGRADCAVYGMVVYPASAAPLTLSHRLAPRNRVYEGFRPALVFREHTHPYAFRVAFRRDFLLDAGLRFDEGLSLGEDEAFLLCAYRLSTRTLLSSARIYEYRMKPQSVSHTLNESDAGLPSKLGRHLDLVASVLGEWRLRGLDDSCDRQILVWALDLLMLDLSRLDVQAQLPYYARLMEILDAYFADGMPRMSPLTRGCVHDIRHALATADNKPTRERRAPVVGKARLVAFYVRSRGLLPVAERALRTLRGRGAY